MLNTPHDPSRQIREAPSYTSRGPDHPPASIDHQHPMACCPAPVRNVTRAQRHPWGPPSCQQRRPSRLSRPGEVSPWGETPANLMRLPPWPQATPQAPLGVIDERREIDAHARAVHRA
ncbi:MAG TPA: hypothetical protein VFY23_02300, partial [Candidatus Limnocylindrales bacterium]|nr:hypothetical protein [Candidatus Limnocylindrales bacterium]